MKRNQATIWLSESEKNNLKWLAHDVPISRFLHNAIFNKSGKIRNEFAEYVRAVNESDYFERGENG